MQSVNITTFEKLRGRRLCWRALLSIIISLTITILLFPEWLESDVTPLPEAVTPLPEAFLGVLLYGLFFLFSLRMLSRADMSYSRLFGTFPPWRILRRYIVWVVPLLILTIASIYSLYFPLSFLLPGVFEWWFLENSPTTMVLIQGDNYALANLLNFFTIVLIAPILEEFFFRGILLTRWTVKWKIHTSIVISSLAFAILHTDLIGSFCFGYAMAIFYIRTKSLFIPICVHIANNGIAWIVGSIEARLDNSEVTLQEEIVHFQEFWWVGLLGMVIVIPAMLYFKKHYIQPITWQIPYLSDPD